MNKKYIKSLFKRILISIVIFLVIGIFVNYSDDNLLLFKRYCYDQTIKFNKISSWYNKYLGSLIDNPERVVMANKEITYGEYTSYKDGVELKDVSIVYPFKSGIVVFIGDKEDYGKTVIIQGMDGIDYWYGNIDNINIKLYDYVESDVLIGEAKDNRLYLLFMKDNKVLNYEDFL